MTPVVLARRAIEIRLALIYGAVFVVFGVQAPFLPVWLSDRGFSVSQIALVLACPRILQVLLVPVLGRWADRHGGIVAMLLVSCVAMTFLFAALAAPAGPAPTLIAVGLLFVAQSGPMPLIDVLAFSIFAPGNPAVADDDARAPFDYGSLRKWGSAAYIGGNLLAGAFLTLTSLTAITLLLAVASAAATAVTLRALPLDRLTHPAHRQQSAVRHGASSRLWPIVIAAAAAIQASHAMVLGFASVHWAESGHSDAFIGVAWAIGVAVETLVFAVFGRWVAGPDRAVGLMIAGGLAATARWSIMAFDPNDAVLLVVQASHGLSFAATHAGTMLLIAEMAPVDRRARVQGWLTAAIAGLTAVLTVASGPLIVRFGEHSYFAMTIFALAGTLLAASVAALRAKA